MPEQNATDSRGDSYHRRLVTLVDCAYALVIVLAVAGMPTPRDVG